MRYEAIKGIADELKKGLQQVARRGSKLAFSSLKDANFEYADDQQDAEIIHGLIQALVENNNERFNYTILERIPQALVRLAQESVYTAEPALKKKQYLEYKLRTVYQNPKKPFVYGAEISGVNDTRSAIGKTTSTNLIGERTDATRKTNHTNQSKYNQFKEKGSLHQEFHRKGPLMFARFDTADFLVVIERLEDGPVQRSAADYYDPIYNAKAIKRTARIKINARILDDNGKILWIKNITKQVSDLVLPDYAPPVQIWTESTNRIPSQDTNAASDIVIGY
ncbi:MAG: hypothetical protein D3911_03925 [Candidatus Electrothrix sp. AW3_4]|nr:hypothetical protein [Candidatus Electrothrix gigas]